jgi:PAS domain S-box-containing protein
MSLKPAKPSLSKHLSLSLGILSTVIVLVVTSLVFLFLTWRVGQSMEERAGNSIAFLTQSLETPLWALDRESAVAVAQATVMDPSVGLLELRDAKGEAWFVHGTGKRLFILREADVTHQGEVIGHVRLGLDDAERVRAVAGIGLVGGGVALFIIIAQYFLGARLMRSSFRRPFDALDSLVTAYARGEYSVAKPDVRYAEFEPLVRAFVGMGGTIERQISELRESEERYRAIFDNSPVGIFRTTFTGKLLEGNPALARMFGYGSDKDLLRLARPSVQAVYADPGLREHFVKSVAESSTPVSIETQLVRKDGSAFEAILTASAQRDANGRPLFLNGVVEDVSARREAERSLARERQLMAAIFESVPGLLFLYDSEGRLVRWNQAHENMTGYTSEELLGRYVLDWFDGNRKNVARVVAAMRRGLKEGAATVEAEMKTRGGRKIPLLLSGVSVTVDGESYLTGIGIDITERKEVEERLRQSEEKFSRLFRLSPDIIALMSLDDGRIIDVNEAFSRVTGFSWDEAVGRTAWDIGLYESGLSREVLKEAVRERELVENVDFNLQRKGGGEAVPCVLSAQRLVVEGQECVLCVLRDVRELKRMQEMMIQSEKMISVGGIAAGVAHEINNPLGIIMVTSQNLKQRTRPDFPRNIEVARSIGLDMDLLDRYMRSRGLHGFIENIQQAAMRAADIIRHMLDFSRRSESRRKVCDLRAVMERSIFLAENDYDLKKNYDFRRMRIEWDCDDSPRLINCTETEIEQVFLNLLRNSAQAMASAVPEIGDPCMSIRIFDRGDMVVVEMEDNGPGMAPEVQRRAFEPFFTTKPPGVGTGLGLSVSYFIITRSHDGRMSLESSPGGGAKFTIELPAVDRAATEPPCGRE